jgi:hypothetical protein
MEGLTFEAVLPCRLPRPATCARQSDFPDFRIEYELHGRDRHEDIEFVTEHYRGAHAAAVAAQDFVAMAAAAAAAGVAAGGSIRTPRRTSCAKDRPSQAARK